MSIGETGYIFGYLGIFITFIVVVVITAIIGKRKRNKKTENPRAEKAIKKELREVLNSEDGKIKGTLLAWCILTGFMIAQGIIFGGDEFVNWIHAGCLLALLILVIKGRGSRYLIVIFTGLITVGLFVNTVNTTGSGLRTTYCFADWSKCSLYYDIPDYVWENEARISRIGGAIMASYYGITALYFGLSKRAKKHFAWGQRQAELWLELEKRDSLGQMRAKNENKPEANSDDIDDDRDDDVQAELKALQEENRKLADKIEKLERKTKKEGR